MVSGETGLSPKTLNNLKEQTGVVSKVQSLEANALNVPESDGVLSHLLGLSHVRTKADRVNIVYNWLNYCGYRRDQRIRKSMKDLNGYWSDMTHVGYASYCHALITRDARQADKALATYEYLEIPTAVLDLNVQGR